jgi:hypothetical protein
VIERKKGMETTISPKANLIQNSERNEEYGYPVPDSNKIKINDTKKPSNAHKISERRNPASNH